MRKLRIFIVEDNAIIALDIEKRVTKMGHSVVGTAASADEALNAIDNTSPDLVLMDIKLKGDTDGIELTERIHENLPTPVIYVTAYSERNMVKRAMKTDPLGFILKPIKSSDLEKALNSAILVIDK